MIPIIGVDFDATLVEHEYPEIGKPVPGALDWLHRFKAEGARLILWTMRSGAQLEEATKYIESHGIELFGVNENPEQDSWTKSPKAYAHIYIDDSAFGCPMIEIDGIAMADWSKIGPAVLRRIREEAAKGGGIKGECERCRHSAEDHEDYGAGPCMLCRCDKFGHS